MNLRTWAISVLRDIPKGKTEQQAAALQKAADSGFFQRPDVQAWVWMTLARDANRALKVPSVPIEPEESEDEGSAFAGPERTYKERELLTEPDVRWILKECRDTIGQNRAKGIKYMAYAIERGFRSLRDEFPEFDPIQ